MADVKSRILAGIFVIPGSFNPFLHKLNIPEYFRDCRKSPKE